MAHNRLHFLDPGPLQLTNASDPFALQSLDLSHNRLLRLLPPQPSLRPSPAFSHLRELLAGHNPLTNADLSALQAAFPRLARLSFTACPNLTSLRVPGPGLLPSLAELDLSATAKLKALDLSRLPGLTVLNVNTAGTEVVEGLGSQVELLADNTWHWQCDCRILWLLRLPHAKARLSLAFCAKDMDRDVPRSLASLVGPAATHRFDADCAAPTVRNCTRRTSAYAVGEAARLECHFGGEPRPLVIWKSPAGHSFRSR